MTDITLNATAAFDRGLFRASGGSVRHLVARLTASAADDRRHGERAPLNIALAMDASGSMGGGKLEAAKRAALGLAERLTPQDRLTVVSFASEILTHLDAVPATEANAARIRAEISQLNTRGMTCLSGGWFAGVDCAARIAEENPAMTARVIILSDGHANEGVTNHGELREHAGQLRMRGVLTSALGIGDDYDEQLLRGIAEHGGGRLHDAELATEISSVLLGELDDIFATVVDDARLTLTAPDGVRVAVLGNADAAVDGRRASVPLGPVQGGVERVAVFRVTCPQARPGEELPFAIAANGRAADDRSPIEAVAARARLVGAEEAADTAQFRDDGTAEQVARTWSAHVVAEVARMNRDGAFDQAEKYVEGELREFRHYVEGLDCGPAMIDELELLSRHAGGALSSRTHKEMVLCSHMELHSRVDWRGKDKAGWADRIGADG